MTADELRTLILAGDAQHLLDALPGVVESERPKLAKLAVSLLTTTQSSDAHIRAGRQWGANHAQCCAHLAVLGLGSWEQVKRLRRDVGHLSSNDINLYDWVPEFLKARRPDWIERWVSHQLADEGLPAWGKVRKLVREGFCPTPTDDNYIIKMVDGFWPQRIADYKWKLVDSLRADPGLLEHEIWRLFEIESPGQGVLLFANDLEVQPMSWSNALKTLSESGEIDRARLLTESLEALRRGRRAAGASWYFKFHEFLDPTLDERDERQLVYVDLLSNAVPAVVAFALDALSLLAKEKRLEANACINAVPRVFEVAPKGPPVAAIKLLGQLVKQQPDIAVRGAIAACHALGHESPDVQKAGLAWLESLKLAPNDALAGELDNHIQSVAASLRERVSQLQQRVQSNGSAATASATDSGVKGKRASKSRAAGVESSNPQRDQLSLETAKTPTPATGTSGSFPVRNEHEKKFAPEEAALRDEIATLTDGQLAAAGINSSLRVLDNGGELVAVPVNPLKMRHLLPEHELTPIASLDDLIEELSSAIEGPCDADQFERLLDGLSRLCDQRPPDFAARTAPLLKRAAKLSMDFSPSFQNELGLRGLSFSLVAAWCQPDRAIGIKAKQFRRTGFEFVVDRVRELFRRITVGLAAPLLAAPTHRGGWLSTVTFVNRLQAWQQAGLEPYPRDVVQALLRLVPDDRSAASAAARELKSPLGDVVRFALGGPLNEAAALAAGHHEFWIAAVRGRDPSDTVLNDGTYRDGPDVWTPASREWHAVRRPESLPEKTAWPLKIEVAVKPSFVEEAFQEGLPTLKLNYEPRLDEARVTKHRQRLQNEWPLWSVEAIEHVLRAYDLVWGPGTAAAVLRIWPLNPDPTFVTGLVSILCAHDTPASTLRRTSEFLEPLFSTQTRFTEMAQLLLAVSLLAKDSGLKGYAVDALITLIEDGRCVGDELGDVLRKLLISDAVKCNRLAEQLGEVARVSLLHTHVCSRIVQTMFSDAASLPNTMLPSDAHHLLAPLHEWLVELDEPLNEATRSVLAKVTGASKTAKLANGLLARTSPANTAKRREVIVASLRGRLRRARLCLP